MALQTVLEKLQITNEKNILIQGLPSSIEKQFIKLNFAKSVTPLLRTRRIDLAMVFAISRSQLSGILNDVIPALHEDAKLWIAYPKLTSKIASDLCRDCNWDMISSMGFETVSLLALDNTWSAIHFKRLKMTDLKRNGSASYTQVSDLKPKGVIIPEEFLYEFRKNKDAGILFESLSVTKKKEYVEWVSDAKRIETRIKRLASVLEELSMGKTSVVTT